MKKFIIIFISILIFITIASIIFYFFIFTDDNTNSNTNLINNVSIKNDAYDISLENLPLEFSIEDAINSNYFVCGYEKNYNEDKLNTFISNIENRTPSSLRIAFSTPEGDVVLKELVLENDNIIFREDNRRDEFSSKEDRIIKESSFPVSDYRIVEDFLGETKYIYLENRNKDFNSRVFICSCFNTLEYNHNFQLIFKGRRDMGINTIIEKGTYLDYNVYSFAGDVFVKIDNVEISLKDAIINKQIDPQDIVDNCTLDIKENKNNVVFNEANDGGTRKYRYDLANQEPYSIIKCHTLDGNRDLYIGVPNMEFDGSTVDWLYYN